MSRDLNIKEFAERVERLCDYILSRLSAEQARSGSKDVMVLERMKEDAADIQFDRVSLTENTLLGLYDHMFGVSEETT